MDESTGPAAPARVLRGPDGAEIPGAAPTAPDTTTPPPAAGWRGFAERRITGLPAPFWWLWLGTLVNRAGTFIEPFFVLYLTGPRHVSVRTTGVVLTVWGVGSLLA